MISLTLVASCETIKPSVENPVEGWAVLAEKDYYEAPDEPDTLVDYIDITLMRQALEVSGWNPEHIHDLREYTQETLRAELDWLEEITDENDIVILYITGHASYLRDEVLWHDFFADEWSQISSQRRVLIVDSTKAANFTNVVRRNDPLLYLSIASAAENEYSWVGLKEEGLPIIGSVFTHYFADALNNLDADANGDGLVSVQEAALLAEGQQRTYMHEVVLVVPEFVDMFHANVVAPEQDPTYPNVIMDDAIGEPLFLALDVYP